MTGETSAILKSSVLTVDTAVLGFDLADAGLYGQRQEVLRFEGKILSMLQ